MLKKVVSLVLLFVFALSFIQLFNVAIREKHSDTILFMGKVLEPMYEEDNL
jgi:serine protease inhibitor